MRVISVFALVVLLPCWTAGPLAGQTRPLAADSAAVADGHRPIPGPVYESSGFTRAVARGTRTRDGRPGDRAWVQYARYRIDASLDAGKGRLTGHERVVYLNRSPDTLARVAVHLRQNAFAAGSARLAPLPVTGGVALSRVAVDGRVVGPAVAGDTVSAATRLDGTVLWVRLGRALLPSDSVTLELDWQYVVPPSPSDGRQGREADVIFLGYWYPQVAVYDDVSGWVADQYTAGAEFYMDMADYDVRLRVPEGWVVGATGTLQDSASVLAPRTLERLARARRSRDVVHVIEPAEIGRDGALVRGRPTWHFAASGVRDFAWGVGRHYAWDAVAAIVADSARDRPDTVMIHSFFRLDSAAAAWRQGGARFTRDAIERLSAWLWPYPWPQMTSMEGVLTSGGMEYPMLTLMQPWADTLSLAGDLMHETGHMWFPMQVGSNETRHPWMDEGLTQFNAAQGMRALYGEPRTGGRPNDTEQGQRGLYVQAAAAGQDMALMTWGDLAPPDFYFIGFYDKTAQVLAALRGLVGQATVQRGLREYGRRWSGRHPEPEDFFNALDRLTGRDLGWFWESWFYRAWPLDQAVGGVTASADSTWIVIEDRGLVPMPVRLAITRRGGRVERREIPVSAWLAGTRRLRLAVGGGPPVIRVAIDPEGLFPDVNPDNQRWEDAGAAAPPPSR